MRGSSRIACSLSMSLQVSGSSLQMYFEFYYIGVMYNTNCSVHLNIWWKRSLHTICVSVFANHHMSYGTWYARDGQKHKASPYRTCNIAYYIHCTVTMTWCKSTGHGWGVGRSDGDHLAPVSTLRCWTLFKDDTSFKRFPFNGTPKHLHARFMVSNKMIIQHQYGTSICHTIHMAHSTYS